MGTVSEAPLHIRYHHLHSMYNVEDWRYRLAGADLGKVTPLEDLHIHPELWSGELQEALRVDKQETKRWFKKNTEMDEIVYQDYYGEDGTQMDLAVGLALPVYARFFLSPPQTPLVLSREPDDICRSCVLKTTAGVGRHCVFNLDSTIVNADYLSFLALQRMREAPDSLYRDSLVPISKHPKTPTLQTTLGTVRDYDFMREFKNNYRSVRLSLQSFPNLQRSFDHPSFGNWLRSYTGYYIQSWIDSFWRRSGSIGSTST